MEPMIFMGGLAVLLLAILAAAAYYIGKRDLADDLVDQAVSPSDPAVDQAKAQEKATVLGFGGTVLKRLPAPAQSNSSKAADLVTIEIKPVASAAGDFVEDLVEDTTDQLLDDIVDHLGQAEPYYNQAGEIIAGDAEVPESAIKTGPLEALPSLPTADLMRELDAAAHRYDDAPRIGFYAPAESAAPEPSLACASSDSSSSPDSSSCSISE